MSVIHRDFEQFYIDNQQRVNAHYKQKRFVLTNVFVKTNRFLFYDA